MDYCKKEPLFWNPCLIFSLEPLLGQVIWPRFWMLENDTNWQLTNKYWNFKSNIEMFFKAVCNKAVSYFYQCSLLMKNWWIFCLIHFKSLYFLICILPNYVPHEITKEFWKNDSWFPSEVLKLTLVRYPWNDAFSRMTFFYFHQYCPSNMFLFSPLLDSS